MSLSGMDRIHAGAGHRGHLQTLLASSIHTSSSLNKIFLPSTRPHWRKTVVWTPASIRRAVRTDQKSMYAEVDKDMLPNGVPNTAPGRILYALTTALTIREVGDIAMRDSKKIQWWGPKHVAAAIHQLAKLTYFKGVAGDKSEHLKDELWHTLYRLEKKEMLKGNSPGMRLVEARQAARLLVASALLQVKLRPIASMGLLQELLRDSATKLKLVAKEPELFCELVSVLPEIVGRRAVKVQNPLASGMAGGDDEAEASSDDAEEDAVSRATTNPLSSAAGSRSSTSTTSSSTSSVSDGAAGGGTGGGAAVNVESLPCTRKGLVAVTETMWTLLHMVAAKKVLPTGACREQDILNLVTGFVKSGVADEALLDALAIAVLRPAAPRPRALGAGVGTKQVAAPAEAVNPGAETQQQLCFPSDCESIAKLAAHFACSEKPRPKLFSALSAAFVREIDAHLRISDTSGTTLHDAAPAALTASPSVKPARVLDDVVAAAAAAAPDILPPRAPAPSSSRRASTAAAVAQERAPQAAAVAEGRAPAPPTRWAPGGVRATQADATAATAAAATPAPAATALASSAILSSPAINALQSLANASARQQPRQKKPLSDRPQLFEDRTKNRRVPPTALVRMAVAVAAVRHKDERLMQRIADVALLTSEDRGRRSGKPLSVWAFGQEERGQGIQFSIRECVQLAKAYVQLDVHHRELFDHLAVCYVHQGDRPGIRPDTSELSDMARAFGLIEHPHKTLFSFIGRLVLPRVAELTATELVDLAVGFASVDESNEALYEAITAAVVPCVRKLNATQISELTWVFQKTHRRECSQALLAALAAAQPTPELPADMPLEWRPNTRYRPRMAST